MKRITTILLAGFATLFFTACGGGGGSGETTTKNTLEKSEGQTALGYYGPDIYIGDHKGHKYWSIEREGYSGQVILELPDSGNELSALDTTDGSADFWMADYGVSADARIINIDMDYDGSIDIEIEIYRSVNSQTYDAYVSNPHTGEGFSAILMTTTD